jgi:hypothetical protein
MPVSANPSPAEIVAALQRGGITAALKLVLAAKRSGSSGDPSVANQGRGRLELFKSSPLSSKATDLSPGEVPRSRGDIWLLLLVIAALCTAYHFFAR